ncbi:hypothetical protein V8F06_013609 [Rhypophila decipiens]
MDSTHKKTTNQETHGNITNQQVLISASQWNKAPNWRHLVQFNKTLLKYFQIPGSKKRPFLPYQDDFEGDLIPRLLILHKYGLFVISGMWEERKQAQYLEFFIPHGETSKKFIELLLNDNQLQGVAFDCKGTKLTGSSENDIEVAWYRESWSQESLNYAIWETESVILATHN